MASSCGLRTGTCGQSEQEPASSQLPHTPRSVTTARTGCHGGLSELVPAGEVDAATVLSHTSGRSRRIRYRRSGVARAARNAADARGTANTSSKYDRLAARPVAP